MGFDYGLDFKNLDLRKKFYLYKVGRGEQGVLLVRPYKEEILPFWRFKTPELAHESAEKILSLFYQYKKNCDFIGMDMARKFLQMGYTRSRRYANHASGKKYVGPVPKNKKGKSGAHGREVSAYEYDEQKAESAKIFYEYWMKVEADIIYHDQKIGWKILFG
jgi:hypothetical protein